MRRAECHPVTTIPLRSLGSGTPDDSHQATIEFGSRAAGRAVCYHPPESQNDHELLQCVLAMVLGRGPSRSLDARETASRLLQEFGGVGGLRQCMHLLSPSRAMPSGKAPRTNCPPALTPLQLNRLAAIIELGRRVCRSPLQGRQLKSHTDVQAWATGRLTDLEHEEVWILAVTSSSRVLGEWCVGKGGLHGCGLLPSDILRPAVRAGTPALVLVHNHPSGDPTPSREDVAMTRTLHEACKAVGVILLDHVIVSRNGSQSLAERGLY